MSGNRLDERKSEREIFQKIYGCVKDMQMNIWLVTYKEKPRQKI